MKEKDDFIYEIDDYDDFGENYELVCKVGNIIVLVVVILLSLLTFYLCILK